MSDILFIAGIDTNVGKSYATGWLAEILRWDGFSVTTMKLAQTGNEHVSEDIRLHRRLMGEPWNAWDERGVTCPQLFKFPASPHLAAALEHRRFSSDAMDQAVSELAGQFSWILMEGVGGIEVPLDGTYTVMDFIVDRGYPCLVVTCPRVGSINHTVLTVRAMLARGLAVKGLVYNLGIPAAPEVVRDTRSVFERFFPALPIIDLPEIAIGSPMASESAEAFLTLGLT
jgi:dethiobiotin synthetase